MVVDRKAVLWVFVGIIIISVAIAVDNGCPSGKESISVCNQQYCITPRCEINIDCADKILCDEHSSPRCVSGRCACINNDQIEVVGDLNISLESEVPAPLGLECHSQESIVTAVWYNYLS